MVTMVIMISLLFASIFASGVYWVRNTTRNRAQRVVMLKKLNSIRKNIQDEIYQRRNKEYFEYLSSYIRTTTPSKISQLMKVLKEEDDIYVKLKQDLRLLDQVEELLGEKIPYKDIHTKSKKIVMLMEEKYKGTVDKYLTKFNKKYNYYAENDIHELQKLITTAKELYKINDSKLKDVFNEIERKKGDILLQLEEPIRLRDKFIHSEDNIEKAEDDLKNTKGMLYHKVFELIKSNDIPKEDATTWNIIKQEINTYKKNRILDTDVIELSNKLNEIIRNLSDLSFTLSNRKNVSDKVKII